jgi:hypothetical protein
MRKEKNILADTIEDFLRQEAERDAKRKQFIQQLLDQRKAIDDQLTALNRLGRNTSIKAQRVCSRCGKPGHNAASHKKNGRGKLRSKAKSA